MQEISLLQAHMIAFAAGFVLDLIIGDPHWMPHPVRWIGSLIAALDRILLGDLPSDDPNSELRNPADERRAGTMMVLIVVSVTAILTLIVMAAAYKAHIVCGIVIEAVLTCYLLAMTSLRRESMNVYRALVKGNPTASRQAVSMIVGRDVAVLDEEGVTKAAVETVAENFSDGVMAPMIYAAIGGPVLGLTYKAINTMDSMVGYRNDRYMWFGAPAAHLDDIVNYIPARISALLLIAASAIAGKEFSAPRAYRIWKRDRFNHKSPNAAQTESAAAGALGLQLAGDAQYFGKTVRKPFIGDKVREIEAFDIVRVNRLMTAASFIGFALCMVVIYTAASIFI
jgi:adenosylcobinamide-phosphate synthase